MHGHPRARAVSVAAYALPVLVAAPLLMLSLGNGMLWRDEAETACLARSVLKYGLPVANDGVNVVTTEAGRDIGPRGDYVLSPPGQVYTCALSFAVFGSSTWSARLPFALLALLTLCVCMRLCRRYSSRWGAPLAVWALVCCVPFYLYARQCRYYACVMLAGVVVVYCYLESEKQGWKARSWAFVGLVCALLYAWYCHLVTFAVLGLSVLSHLLIRGNGPLRARVAWAFLVIAVVGVGVLPWALHSNMFRWAAGSPRPSWDGLAEAVTTYLASVASVFLLPILVVWLIGRLLVPGYTTFVTRSPLYKLAWWIIVIGSASFLLIGSLRLTWPWGRYLCSLVPLYAVVAGELLAPIWRASKAAAVLVMLVCLTTNIPCWVLFAGVPHGSRLHDWNPTYRVGVRMWLLEHMLSLVHPYRGPLEGIISYVVPRSREGDTAFIEFEAESLMFYTKLKVLRELPFSEPPRWIILRPQGAHNAMFTLVRGITTNPASRQRHFPMWRHVGLEDCRGSPAANRAYLLRYVRSNHYRKIVLPFPDWGMENYPELIGHRFRSDNGEAGLAPVTIYERACL